MAFTVSCTATGDTTARFSARFSGGQASFSGYRYVRLYIDGVDTYEIRSSSKGGASSRFSKTIRGLEPDTEYFWAARLGYENGSDITWLDITDDGYFTTEKSRVEVDPWDWFSSNGSATATQTSNAYSAVQSKGKLSNFSYRVWNDLVEKVNELVETSDGIWNSRYASLPETKMSSSSRTMTATRFNSLRYNMGRFHTFSTYYFFWAFEFPKRPY